VLQTQLDDRRIHAPQHGDEQQHALGEKRILPVVQDGRFPDYLAFFALVSPVARWSRRWQRGST
jgi:hypothetical protein